MQPQNDNPNIYRGRVVFFRSDKGFGFIKREDNGQDVFVHFTEIVAEGYRKLDTDQMVQFEIGPGLKSGTVQAKNVTVIQ